VNDYRWEFWIDRGGTFTDIVARRSDGHLVVKKLLSENPRQYADAAVKGIREILGIGDDESLPTELVSVIKLGTTVATNALLERAGEPTVLVTTKGFGDALRIGYQNRPDIFARNIVLPEQLYKTVIEAKERVTANGGIEIELNQEQLAAELGECKKAGITSCAIVFMHGYMYPAHEKAAALLARDIGFTQVSPSHEVSPLIKFVTRGETTVADAYLSPVLKRYVDNLRSKLGNLKLLFMQSSGGLVDANHFRGRNSLLSGPAGGIVGAAKTCAQIGITKLLSFDMGGTSTDVAHYNGGYERQFDSVVAGFRINAPMMDIHTVAAGGGSVCQFRQARLQVGPESAGANPGPACYRNGGPLTITDCNLFLGRLHPEFFPKVFGPLGDQSPDSKAVDKRLSELLAQLNGQYRTSWRKEELAEKLLSIAIEKMASAIKKVSVERGQDIQDYALACFGGAGGQHACKIADALSVSRIVIHPLAGVLSAVGIGLSEVRVLKEKSVGEELRPTLVDHLRTMAEDLRETICQSLREQGVDEGNIEWKETALLRYTGTDFSMSVFLAESTTMKSEFREEHYKRYGFISDKPLTVEAICVEGMEKTISLPIYAVSIKSTGSNASTASAASTNTTRMYCNGRWLDVPLLHRGALEPQQRLSGPALITDQNSTTVVEEGWAAEVDQFGNLIMEKAEAGAIQPAPPHKNAPTTGTAKEVDPAKLELFNNLFTSAAEEMGLQLQRTSHSVNIKERLDYSCALFDNEGRLIANAPHIPVHLGSMGESIQSLIAAHRGDLQSGDAFVLNNPFNGGTHLPDITVMSPVFSADKKRVLFFVASRGHHADIGGITPGSMPADSKSLGQEGVVIDNILLLRDGKFREEEMNSLLGSGQYPARNIAQNIADLKAQVAANFRGAQKLMQFVADYGETTVTDYMRFVRANAASAVQEVIEKLKDGEFTNFMDDGSRISLCIKVDRVSKKAHIDFAGTSKQVEGNLNAPRSICRAAVLYVFRTLIEQQIPLNDGCLEPVEISMPEGSIINPMFPAAVVAGNVETSQVITDCLYGALGALAGSQGTMNNFTFGNERYQYYETICGGAGAGPGFAGASAVHTHMTNSRLTDPEVLELRFPVILEGFSIRRGSGGKGCYSGGDGVVRRVRFLESMTASILSQRRIVQPFGLDGGGAGASGLNYVIRAKGDRVDLSGTATIAVSPGDVFVIETPGGGAYGKLENDPTERSLATNRGQQVLPPTGRQANAGQFAL
jgi:5-oxoprolinase (ATP-hydrolysing)